MFFFKSVEHKVRSFTNKQEFWTLLHLRPFRQFQNLSDETWSRAAKNYRIMLYGISKLQKWEMLRSSLNNFPVFRNYRDIDFALSCMDVLVTNAQVAMNWNLMLNFVKLKQRIFKWHSTSYWPNVGVGYLEKSLIFNFLASAWDSESHFDQLDQSSDNRALETLLAVHQRLFVSSWTIYLR